MNEFLLYISNSGIILAFIAYFIILLLNKGKIATKSNSFNITKDILHEYDSINIIENKDSFTNYNIKRRIVRLSSKNYYGNSVSDIAISLEEAGISAIDNYKNKYINIIRNIIPNLKCLYILPLLSIAINHITYNISDAKVSLPIIGFFTLVNYIFIIIKNESTNWIIANITKIKDLSKENQQKILKHINFVNLLDKIILLSELIMLVRFMVIILEI